MADYDAPERGLFGSGRSWFGKRTAPPFTLLDLRLQNLFPIRVTLSRTGSLPARVGLRKDIVFLDLIRLAGWKGCKVIGDEREFGGRRALWALFISEHPRQSLCLRLAASLASLLINSIDCGPRRTLHFQKAILSTVLPARSVCDGAVGGGQLHELSCSERQQQGHQGGRRSIPSFQDTIFNGVINLNVPLRAVEYR